MRFQRKYVNLTPKEQWFIQELNECNGHWLNFEKQKIFKNRNSFNRSMRRLHKLELFDKGTMIVKGKMVTIFKLNWKSELYYGDFLLILKNIMR